MCGRYFRHSPREELAAAFGAELGTASAAPGYNIAPSQQVLAVRFNTQTGVRTLDDLRWGLIPSFAKDAKIGWKTINARAETVDEKPVYRTAFARRRCLIIADGFFEWKAVGEGKRARKQPYAIALEHRKPFALAGLWENWRNPETGEWLQTCSIVTTDASEQMSTLHDRMPAILHPDDYGAWLGEEPAPLNELKALLRPWDGPLVIWPVSPRMNSPGKTADGRKYSMKRRMRRTASSAQKRARRAAEQPAWRRGALNDVPEDEAQLDGLRFYPPEWASQ